MHRLFRSFILLAVLCTAFTLLQAGESRVGDLYPLDADGASLQTRAETVYSGKRVVHSGAGGILRLDNDQVIQLSENSAAIFELHGDFVEVRVLAGTLRAVGEEGRVLVAGSGSRFRLGQAENYPDEAEALLLGQPFDRKAMRSDEIEASADQRRSKSAISGR